MKNALKIKPSVLAGIAGFIVAAIAAHGRSTPYNNYTLFASAVLHGRLWIDWPGSYIDAVLWNGHRYIVNDPLPGLLMIPLVLLFGMQANQTFLALVLCGIGVGAAWELGERLGVPRKTNAWLCVFFLGGTGLLWASMLGDVWFIAQTSCVCFMTLALVELSGKNRAWLVALYYIAAILSRFTVVMAFPVIVYLIFTGGLRAEAVNWRERFRPTLEQLAQVCIPALLIYVWYNLARWGVPWDSGHTIFFHEDPIGSAAGEPFSLHSLPYQLWSFFVQAPDFNASFPWIRPTMSGVALTWCEPALLLAFFARGARRVIIACWIAVFLAAGPNLLYYVNGFAQYGMRHSLDFMPFLYVLMIFALRARFGVIAKALLAYSTLAGLYGVWFWNTFVRPQN